VPATYKITSGGRLSPPTVTSPAGFTVQFTFIDRDSVKHRVVVKTPTPLVTVVPPGGYAYMLVSHLPKGTYPITVDGTVRGSLMIGGAPGP
jgi:hypothetical protein